MSKDIEIVDVTDKKKLECPHCGFEVNIPPRTMSMEKLRQMQSNKRFAAWQKRHVPKAQSVSNVRLLTCPKCEQATICKDRFSIEV